MTQYYTAQFCTVLNVKVPTTQTKISHLNSKGFFKKLKTGCKLP